MTTPEIAIVVSPRDWAERLHRFVADHGGARVRARVLDGREALDEDYQVLVAEDLTSFLTPRLVDGLRRSGRRVLGVYDPTEPWGRSRLLELGVDDTIEATAPPERMLQVVDALALAVDADLDGELARLAARHEDDDASPSTAAASAPAAGQAAPRTAHEPRSGAAGVTVVGGPAGAPGATELAIGLAAAAARRGSSVVVVDADEVAPSLAQRLGLPLHPNLRTAIDAVQHWSGQLPDTLTPVPAGGFTVLCGLPSTADWSAVRPGEVVDVVVDLARLHDHVIVNVGHRLEEVGGPGANSRYGTSRTLVAEAQTVVGVLAPTPVGLARYLEWVADVRTLTRRPIHTVVNRAPSSAFQRAELEAELRRTYEPPSVTTVPFDRRVADAAWAGELVPGAAYRRALDRVAGTVLPARSAPAQAAVRAPGRTPAGRAAR